MTCSTGWRVQGDERGFDELVTPLCHLEMMDARCMDVYFGEVHLTVWRDGLGIHVRHDEGTILGPEEEL